jgi:hypothetical protein
LTPAMSHGLAILCGELPFTTGFVISRRGRRTPVRGLASGVWSPLRLKPYYLQALLTVARILL